jgi:hypothetical protein
MPEFFSPGKEGVESKKGDRFIYGHQGIGLLSPPQYAKNMPSCLTELSSSRYPEWT